MLLERALRTRDVVLFNIVAVIGLRWIALAAAAGPSSLSLWVLAALVFFIPQGLAVIALATAIPEEGGLYVWTSRAFGPRHAFLVGWLYWASNVLYFPTLTLTTVVFALYIFGPEYAHLEHARFYAAGAPLGLLAVALVLNIRGLKTGRWLQNLGGLAQWVPSVALLAVGLLALFRAGSATPISAAALVPHVTNLDTVVFFAQMCFAFAGLELAPILASEVIEPRKTFPRAILITAVIVTACYLVGTISLLWALPPREISIVAGVNQAITQAGAKHGLSWLGSPVALLMTLGGLGGIGAWLIGAARLLFVGGLDRYLPPLFVTLHPRWKTPHIALLVQGVLSAAFILAATQGASIKSAYLMLVNATLVVYFIPYLYMFAAAMRLERTIALSPGAVPVPGGRLGSMGVNGVGFLTTLAAILLALIPPAGTHDRGRFFASVFLGSGAFVAAGVLLYALADRRRRREGERSLGPASS